MVLPQPNRPVLPELMLKLEKKDGKIVYVFNTILQEIIACSGKAGLFRCGLILKFLSLRRLRYVHLSDMLEKLYILP